MLWADPVEPGTPLHKLEVKAEPEMQWELWGLISIQTKRCRGTEASLHADEEKLCTARYGQPFFISAVHRKTKSEGLVEAMRL